MKLCPQCEFLYEDDQIFCDMDGESLVHDGRAEAFSDIAPAVTVASPKHSRRRIIVLAVAACLLLSAVLYFAYYVSSRSFDSNPASGTREPQTDLSRQTAAAPVDNSATQPVAGPSQPDTVSESSSVSVDELAEKSESAPNETASASKARDNNLSATDNRLTISKRVPPLPQLKPIPRLPPPQRLATAKPTATVIVEVKPAGRNASKRSKVGAFLKKTGRMLTKPFKR